MSYSNEGLRYSSKVWVRVFWTDGYFVAYADGYFGPKVKVSKKLDRRKNAAIAANMLLSRLDIIELSQIKPITTAKSSWEFDFTIKELTDAQKQAGESHIVPSRVR